MLTVRLRLRTTKHQSVRNLVTRRTLQTAVTLRPNLPTALQRRLSPVTTKQRFSFRNILRIRNRIRSRFDFNNTRIITRVGITSQPSNMTRNTNMLAQKRTRQIKNFRHVNVFRIKMLRHHSVPSQLTTTRTDPFQSRPRRRHRVNQHHGMPNTLAKTKHVAPLQLPSSTELNPCHRAKTRVPTVAGTNSTRLRNNSLPNTQVHSLRITPIQERLPRYTITKINIINRSQHFNIHVGDHAGNRGIRLLTTHQSIENTGTTLQHNISRLIFRQIYQIQHRSHTSLLDRNVNHQHRPTRRTRPSRISGYSIRRSTYHFEVG